MSSQGCARVLGCMPGSGGDTWLHMGTSCSEHWVSQGGKHASCLWLRPGSHHPLGPLDDAGPLLGCLGQAHRAVPPGRG